MIAASPLASQQNTAADADAGLASGWQQAMRQAITDPHELLSLLELDMALLPAARLAAQAFPLRVPRSFVARMRCGDVHDPLLRQVLPLDAELQAADGFSADPTGDLASQAAPGLLHKYDGRALVVTTGACGVHCRYCFRRHFPYDDSAATASRRGETIAYLRNHPDIDEVLLSGGDPLTLSDRRLAEWSAALQELGHIRRLRIHTRQAVVLPERVDDSFCRWLSAVRLQKVVVLHVNHAQEIDAAVIAACRKLRDCGATLLNQSVLLAGVNDRVATLAELSEALFAAGALPYYLHLLDRVHGAAHFEVPESTARQLWQALAARLPGFLLPRLVREIAGQPNKTLLL
jgi:L-lysine 2,3-aminomutase